MKKYKLTKITVKTREVISLSKDAAREIQLPVCPVCHSPLPTPLSAAEHSIAAMEAEKRPAGLLSAGEKGDRDQN